MGRSIGSYSLVEYTAKYIPIRNDFKGLWPFLKTGFAAFSIPLSASSTFSNFA